MRSLLLIAILAAGAVGFASAQTAQVTFYSSASILKAIVPLSGSAFAGYIFDGDNELVLLRYKRFATFTFPAGEHQFSAGFSKKHPPKKGALSVKLVAGTRYFLAASTDYQHYVVVDLMRGILTESDCQQAQASAANVKPTQIKKVNPLQRSAAQPLTQFPSCAP